MTTPLRDDEQAMVACGHSADAVLLLSRRLIEARTALAAAEAELKEWRNSAVSIAIATRDKQLEVAVAALP